MAISLFYKYSKELNRNVMAFLLIFLCFGASAQNFENLLSKEKYDVIVKKCEKRLKKDLNNIEVNFFLATVKSRSASGKYFSPDDAYLLYTKVVDLYQTQNIVQEQKEKEKGPVTESSLLALGDSIYSSGLKLAYQKNTEDGFVHFLTFFKEAPTHYKNRAVIERDKLGYEAAIHENSVEALERYMAKYPMSEYKKNAILKRNQMAFHLAKETNTVESYRYFINKYPEASEVSEALKNIHTLEFDIARSINTISAYETFILNNPDAPQVGLAKESIHGLAFEVAKSSMNPDQLSLFMQKYPGAKQIGEATSLYEDLIYKRKTKDQEWMSYKRFIELFPENHNVSNAKKHLVDLAFKIDDAALLDYVVNHIDRSDLLIERHYKIYTQDGELSTLEKYQNNFPDNHIPNIDQDIYLAQNAEQLFLHQPYDKKNQTAYLNYLKQVSDKEKCFLIVQRILSPLIASKKYSLALKELEKLPVDFRNKKVINLRSILSAVPNSSIKPIPCKEINTPGNEFSPVISADDRKIFFCGHNRSDNIGGEDILECTIQGSIYSTPEVNELSSSSGNEAPVSISSDGTKMFLFQSGKLYYSEKTQDGWSAQQELDTEINSGDWQGDAMLSSDGQHLFFSARRNGEVFNINNMYDKIYHGDNLYATDIFVSSKDSSGNWGYPVNIGGMINTRFCERFPFLHPDMKTLYFSSDGHGGLGKLDVFMSTRLNDSCWTCWSEPVNLGKEINTIENDAGYKITTSGEVAYFSLNNKRPQEASVLFVLDVSGSMSGEKIEELKLVSKKTIEEIIFNNAEVSIVTFDGTCNKPITGYLPFTRDKKQVDIFIENLYAGGGTPMYEAFYEASHILKRTASRTSKNKVLVLMTDGNATSCTRLAPIMNKLKSENCLFRTQSIAYGVDINSVAYSDLNYISGFSGGDFFHAASTNDLGMAFEQANSSIYQIVSGSDNKDIYKIALPNHLRPDFVAKIEGEIRDSKKQPVATTIRWEDLSNKKVIGISKSDPISGHYFIVLPMGKNYGYYIEDSSFFPLSYNIDLRDSTNPVTIAQDMSAITFSEMIEKGIAVPMNNLFFDFGKYALLPASIPELIRIAGIIKRYNLKIEIAGHTDNIGDDDSNQLLSERRANAVREFLMRLGCDGMLLKSVGFGESRPVSSNDKEESRAKNRRVELRFIK